MPKGSVDQGGFSMHWSIIPIGIGILIGVPALVIFGNKYRKNLGYLLFGILIAFLLIVNIIW